MLRQCLVQCFKILVSLALVLLCLDHWHNRWGQGAGGRGQSAPRDFWPGNFCWSTRKIPGKERQGKKGKWRRKEGKSKKKKKRRWKIEYGRRKSYKMMRGPFFFFFFFFSLHFSKPLKFVLGLYQNGNLLPGKSISCQEKNQKKMTLPLWKIFLLLPWSCFVIMNIPLPDEPYRPTNWRLPKKL